MSSPNAAQRQAQILQSLKEGGGVLPLAELAAGFRDLRKHWKILLPLGAAPVVYAGVLYFALLGLVERFGPDIGYPVALFNFVPTGFFVIGAIKVALALVDRKPVKATTFFQLHKELVPAVMLSFGLFFIVGVVTGLGRAFLWFLVKIGAPYLILGVGVTAVLWTLLFSARLGVRSAFAFHVMVEKRLSPTDAYQRSRFLGAGNELRIFAFQVLSWLFVHATLLLPMFVMMLWAAGATLFASGFGGLKQQIAVLFVLGFASLMVLASPTAGLVMNAVAVAFAINVIVVLPAVIMAFARFYRRLAPKATTGTAPLTKRVPAARPATGPLAAKAPRPEPEPPLEEG